MAVIAYHAFPSLIPGGFIGVDIFFVISGYLISGILFRHMAAGRFSLAEFYVRRVKRIFPALLLVLLACLGFGWFVLIADEYRQLGKHMAGGAGFIANLLLWGEAGYFDSSAETKPLLHLWSLGVEEQFYIVWPLIVFAAWKRRGALVWVTLALAAAAFAYNLLNISTNGTAAFYSPLSRFWELALGGLLAYREFQRHEKAALFLKHVGPQFQALAIPRSEVISADSRSLLGAAFLVAGFALITKDNAFPGWWAVLPTVGAALLLSAGPQAVVNRIVLANPAMVAVGLISYPLYLWHWPLLAYAQVVQAGVPAPSVRVAAVVFSILFAWATYAFVERPIRTGKSTKGVALALAGAMLAVGSVGYALVLKDGLPSREVVSLAKYLPQPSLHPAAATAASPANQRVPAMQADSPVSDASRAELKARRAKDLYAIRRLVEDQRKQERYQVCHMTDLESVAQSFEAYLKGNGECIALSLAQKNVLVIGDSMAAEARLALHRAYPNVNFLEISGSACKPFAAGYPDKAHRCARLLDYEFDFLAKHKLEAVVVAANWQDDFAQALPDFKLITDLGHKLLLVGPPLKFTAEVAATLLRMEPADSLNKTMAGMLDQDHFNRVGQMERFALAHSFPYLNRMALYCEGGCPLINEKSEPMVLDKLHLSVPGVELLGARIKHSQALDALVGARLD